MALFIVVAGVALGAGIGMVLQRNAVHAALLLVVNLAAIAVLFLMLGAEFLMAAQVIVYAGAIVILFLFVIMLLGIDRSESLLEPRRFQVRQVIVALLLGLPMAAGLASTIWILPLTDPLPEAPQDYGSVESLGTLLFQDYVLPFEVTSLLLLVAVLGVLMLARRRST